MNWDISYNSKISECYEICNSWCFERAKNQDYSWNEQLQIKEPYVPYIPNNWNGILVLGIAQNLSYDKYREKLQISDSSYDRRKSILRLYHEDEFGKGLGVAPWDEGYLQIAVESSFNSVCAKHTAVSNAVLWSQIKPGKKKGSFIDFPPGFKSPQLLESIELWTRMFKVLSDDIRILITVGKKSDYVGWMAKKGANLDCKQLGWWHPSGRNFSKLSRMKKSLTSKYGERVTLIIEHHPEIKEMKFQEMRILYACHAIERTLNAREQFCHFIDKTNPLLG
jgi:hypothetical protein